MADVSAVEVCAQGLGYLATVELTDRILARQRTSVVADTASEPDDIPPDLTADPAARP